MKTLEIITHINENGGLNLTHLRWSAQHDGLKTANCLSL